MLAGPADASADTVALKGAQNLVNLWCKNAGNKISLRFEIDRGTCTHTSEASRAVSGATGFVLQRFAGAPATKGCVIEDAPWSNSTSRA